MRFLPLTKDMPKEMLPVVHKPTIQYVVEEAVAAGITDILIITGRGKRSIEDHFDRSLELESVLDNNGRQKELDEIMRIANMATIHYVRQKVPRGLGDAVLLARQHVGNEPFAVMLGDTINLSAVPVVKQLMDVQARMGGSVIAVEPVAREKVGDYGIIKGTQVSDRLYDIDDLVEKPSPRKRRRTWASRGHMSYRRSSSIVSNERLRDGEGGATDRCPAVAEQGGEGLWAAVRWTTV